MGVVAKRSSMTFYSGEDHYGHRVRIVLAEKGVAVEIQECDLNNLPEDLATLNPYNSLPTLVDRDLALYEPSVMMEYLDERFPHPPLLSVYPVVRAQSRLYMYRIQRDWSPLVDKILVETSKGKLEKLRKELRDSLISIAPVFAEYDYFMSEDFSLVDCYFAPILWRLPLLGVELLEDQCKPLFEYMDRVFERPAFQESLSDVEREIRE